MIPRFKQSYRMQRLSCTKHISWNASNSK